MHRNTSSILCDVMYRTPNSNYIQREQCITIYILLCLFINTHLFRFKNKYIFLTLDCYKLKYNFKTFFECLKYYLNCSFYFIILGGGPTVPQHIIITANTLYWNTCILCVLSFRPFYPIYGPSLHFTPRAIFQME